MKTIYLDHQATTPTTDVGFTGDGALLERKVRQSAFK